MLMSTNRLRRLLSGSCLLLALPVLGGCSYMKHGGGRSVALAPGGLPWGEELVRRSLMLGSYEQAFERTHTDERSMPDDALLRAVFRGQTAYYAGRWEESAQAFAEADRLTEARFTKSVSRGVLSVLTNDYALNYAPPRTERLFARYYAMLSRVQSGDIDGATVEARRLSALLEQSMHDVEPAERATHAALRDVAGSVFEAAAQWNDAGVAYRNAALLRGTPRAAVDSMVVSRPLGDSATVLLVVEGGFVAHYIAQTLAIPLDDGDARRARTSRTAPISTPNVPVVSDAEAGPALGGNTWPVGSPARERTGAQTRAQRALHGTAHEVNASVLQRVDREMVATQKDTTTQNGTSHVLRFLSALDQLPDGGVFADDAAGSSRTRYLGDLRAHRTWLEVAWPGLVRPRLPSAPVQIGLSVELPANDTSTSADSADGVAQRWQRREDVPLRGAMTANISDAIAADARRQRAARLARLATRTVTRVAVVEAVRDQHGEFAGAVAGFFASGLERADTRAWHLLPGRLSLLRITVPAGHVTSHLRVGEGPNAVPVPVEPFTARAGMVYVLGARVWRDPVEEPRTVARGS